MKAKVGRGNGFRGLANYILDEVKGAELLGGNMTSNNSRDLAKEFSVCRKLRPNVKNPAWHVSLSLPVGENITDDKWRNVAQRFLERMGIDPDMHQYFIAKHNDTDKEHIHLAMNRIGFNSELYHGRNDVMRAIEATHELEKEFGLVLTPTLDPDNKAERKKPTSNEIQMSARTDELPPRVALQNILDEALTDKIDVFAFIERCESAGATVIPNVAKTGRLNGFAFEYGGIKFKGSDLGTKYTYKNLKSTVIYEQDKQAEQLIGTAQKIKRRLDEVNERGATAEQPKSAIDRSDNRGNETTSQADKEHDKQRGQADKANENKTWGARESDRKDGGGREETQKAEQQYQSGSEDSVPDARVSDWRDTHDFADDHTAVFAKTGSKDKSANILKKESLWDEQHKALKADVYRITLIGRNGQKPWVLGKQKEGEKFFTADEVKAKIPLLAKKNVEGRDIYITPRTLSYNYIVVDDLTPQTHKEMIDNGYKPNLVQESSKDNYQAIFRVPKTDHADDRKIANKVVVGLNKKYGDENFTGVMHPFRMAGFSNKKQGRNNFFTRLLNSAEKVCERVVRLLSQELNKVKAEHEQAMKAKLEPAKKPSVSKEEQRIRAMESVDKNTKTASAVFARNWSKHHGLARSKGWSIDFSRIDFAATKDMIKGGYSDQDIQIAIVDCSPSVLDRKHNVQDYCNRTIENAKEAIERTKTKNNNNELGL